MISIIILLIIVVIVAVILFSLKSRNKYILYLTNSLPTVAENIIECIIDEDAKPYSIQDIIDFNTSETDLYLNCIEFIKTEMSNYIDSFIDNNINNKFIYKLVKDYIKLDPSLITDIIDDILINDENMYNALVKLFSNYSNNRMSEIEREENEAKEIAELYENETIEVAEYNGEFDKSEYDIARENFESTEIEYPDKENIDDIPEELVEIAYKAEEDI